MAPATRWGILSAGKIAHDFMVAFTTLNPEEHVTVAVGARSLESAQAFAKLHKIQNAYGSYEEVMTDPNVDVIYIGTLNPSHLPLAKLALDHGKPVLCEKPLCMNVKETKELTEYARAKKIFLMEALWVRFFPAYQKLREELDKGTIGEVHQVMASFGQKIGDFDRLKFKELGGGTILDIGIYTVQFTSFVFGGIKPDRIIAAGQLNEDGVDTSISATLLYPGGRTASLVTHSKVVLPCEGIVVGTKGTLKFPYPFWCSTKLETPNENFEFPLPPVDMKLNFWNTEGLAYQCHEVRRCLVNGITESTIMPHSESLNISEILENIRKQLGVVYPQDE